MVFKAHLEFLADDALEGRAPGTRGGLLAQKYIAAQFERLRLQPAGDSGSYFQRVPIIALTPSSWVARRMNLLWGVQPFVLREAGEYHEQIVDRVDDFLLSKDIVRVGDRLVILMGSPIYQRAKTNLLRVHRVQA